LFRKAAVLNASMASIQGTTGVLDLIMCAQRGLGNLREPNCLLAERTGIGKPENKSGQAVSKRL